jgi:hypothetical protein
MELYILGSLKKIKNKEKENLFSLINQFMKEISKTIVCMDLVGINCFNLKEFINNPIKKNIKEVGR